jgi:hypothetical protein
MTMTLPPAQADRQLPNAPGVRPIDRPDSGGSDLPNSKLPSSRNLSSPSKEDEQLAAQISGPSFTALALVQLLQTLRHLNEKAEH